MMYVKLYCKHFTKSKKTENKIKKTRDMIVFIHNNCIIISITIDNCNGNKTITLTTATTMTIISIIDNTIVKTTISAEKVNATNAEEKKKKSYKRS